ncbi:MAG TPA: hypothetical protein VH395_01615 [Jatrophihabitantaceae bacterium]|jgi:hypothetical protein
MDTTAGARELEAVRQRRAELSDTLDALRRSLADPASDLAPELDRLASDFALHVEVTEGPDGLHQAILAGDLRLANQVQVLAKEHGEIAAEIAAAVAATVSAEPPSREAVSALLDRIVRHREQGATLIREAYQTDIGGGD